jgi:hypothetical protein
MQNVKNLLQNWKHDLAQAGELMGTDLETLDTRGFKNLEFQIKQLESAIKKDDQSKRWAEQEMADFNNHLGRF